MRLTKRKRTTLPKMDMTPMIDIVFLLIIFFMTVTQVSKMNKERLELPQLTGNQDQRPTTLIFNIMANGDIRVSGRTVGVGEVISMINRELRLRGDDPRRVSVVLRVDRNAVSQQANSIMDALKKLRISQAQIAVQVPR